MTLVGNTHLVAGDAGTVAALLRFLQREGIQTSKNPDLYLREYSHFGIDEARDIRTRATMRALGPSTSFDKAPVRGSERPLKAVERQDKSLGASARRIFIITAGVMTHEAQNALLKTTEEATGNTLFFFIVPAPHMLLSTIRSRAQLLDIGLSTQIGLVDQKAFLKALPAKRLLMLKPLLEKGDDDRRDVGAVITFLSSLESTMKHVQVKGVGLESTRGEGLEAIYRARKYIGDKGALMKPLLEQVALLI